MGAGCGTVANTSCGPIISLRVLLWVRDAGLLPILHVTHHIVEGVTMGAGCGTVAILHVDPSHR